jgi:ABC-2 type transport system permease protein
MASDTLLLMRLYLTLDWRQTGEQPLMRVLRITFLLFGGLVLAVLSGLAGFGAGRVIAMPEFQTSVSQGLVPGGLLTLVLLSVLITGPNSAVRALYLSDDLDQLVAAPIETRSILIAKLLSRLSWNVIFVLLLAGPALVMYGVGIGAGIGYYVVGFILLLLAPLFGLSIGALIAMFLVRWLPAKRLGELLAAAYALVGLLIALLFQLPRFINFSDSMSVQTTETIIDYADTIAGAPVPTLWAGQGLVDVGSGSVGIGLSRMLVYLVITLGLFVFTVLVSDRLYLSGWLRMQGLSAKRRGISEGGGRLQGGSITSTLGTKDWLLRVRDPRQLVSLVGGAVVAIVVGGLILFRGTGNDTGILEATQSGEIGLPDQIAFLGAAFSSGVVIAGAVLFIGYSVFSQLAMTSLALEGQSYTILKSAPVTGRHVWQAKAMSVWLPYAVTVTLLMIVAWAVIRFNPLWGIYGVLCLLIMGAGLIALNTALGFRYANLEWTDPRRMNSGGGSFYSFILSVIYLLIAGLTALLFFVLAAAFPGAAFLAALGGLAAVGLITLAVVWLSGRWAESAWRRLGEA